jgi:hypothetical protein
MKLHEALKISEVNKHIDGSEGLYAARKYFSRVDKSLIAFSDDDIIIVWTESSESGNAFVPISRNAKYYCLTYGINYNKLINQDDWEPV